VDPLQFPGTVVALCVGNRPHLTECIPFPRPNPERRVPAQMSQVSRFALIESSSFTDNNASTGGAINIDAAPSGLQPLPLLSLRLPQWGTRHPSVCPGKGANTEGASHG